MDPIIGYGAGAYGADGYGGYADPADPVDPPVPYPWLPVDGTREWLQVAETSPHAAIAETCRQASAAFCQRQRPDLLTVDTTDPDQPVTTFTADPDVVMAGLIGAARLYARRSTPTGLASFGEFGASDILRLDPDVARLLGTGRYAAPVIGGGR